LFVQPTPPKPKLPFEDAAELLADPELVLRLQTSLFASPIVTDTITHASELYLSTEGSVSAVLSYLTEQIPVFQAMVEDALGDQPALMEAFKQALTLLPTMAAPLMGSLFGGEFVALCGRVLWDRCFAWHLQTIIRTGIVGITVLRWPQPS
jgi:hypothetical protein